MDKYTVDFYRTPNGEEPVRTFLDSLDDKMRAKVIRAIGLLQTNGPNLRFPHSEHLDDGIFELRIQTNGNISRVLYFFIVGKRIILTSAFKKKSQKTPSSEIRLAKKYRNEFLSRKDLGNHE